MVHTTRNRFAGFLSALFIFFIASCQKSEVASPDLKNSELSEKRFSISEQDAAEVATFYLSADTFADKTARVVSGDNEVLEKRTISDSTSSEPLFYIFKKRKGFTIVSADLRVMPVLAYSQKSEVNLNSIPNGVSLWIEMAKQKVREAKRDTNPPHPIVLKEWQRYLSRPLRTSDTYCIEWYQYGQFQCKYTSTQKGPLLTTEWGQRHLSTTQLSTGGDCDGCGRRFAGCGPVAMAQLEEFYHPNPARPRFSNGICTATDAGQVSLGALMQIMGEKSLASYNYMGTCATFTWPSNVKSGLKNFGFSNGGNGNEAYNFTLIKSELNGNHPVIFWGSTCLNCFSDYHIWICDGYLQHHYSDFNCTTKQCNQWTFSYLNMNWGWGNESNGYFAFGQYNPDEGDYNANLHVITGIRA